MNSATISATYCNLTGNIDMYNYSIRMFIVSISIVCGLIWLTPEDKRVARLARLIQIILMLQCKVR